MKSLLQYINEYLIKKKVDKVHGGFTGPEEEIAAIMGMDSKRNCGMIAFIKKWLDQRNGEINYYMDPGYKVMLSMDKYKHLFPEHMEDLLDKIHAGIHKYKIKLGSVKNLLSYDGFYIYQDTKNDNILRIQKVMDQYNNIELIIIKE